MELSFNMARAKNSKTYYLLLRKGTRNSLSKLLNLFPCNFLSELARIAQLVFWQREFASAPFRNWWCFLRD